MSYITMIFIVTFTDRAYDSCILKLYNACYHCEIPAIKWPASLAGINHPGDAHSVAFNDSHNLCSTVSCINSELKFLKFYYK